MSGKVSGMSDHGSSLSGITRHNDARLLGQVAHQRGRPGWIGAMRVDRARAVLRVVLEGGDAARRSPITAPATSAKSR